jgi:hypothetical protein
MFPDAELDIMVVWIALKESDTLEAARKTVGKFTDARVKQFYDPQQRSGKAIADRLGYDGKTVWDFYLFYSPGSEWADVTPGPEVYMHQLRNSWADQDRLFEKDGLRMELTRTMKALFP